ncbi:MAG: hypothetical protein HY548_07925, partial [Elusimicrobia bacterium]|nr:hypothetical protein [Elusimicrobiota bacterium]
FNAVRNVLAHFKKEASGIKAGSLKKLINRIAEFADRGDLPGLKHVLKDVGRIITSKEREASGRLDAAKALEKLVEHYSEGTGGLKDLLNEYKAAVAAKDAEKLKSVQAGLGKWLEGNKDFVAALKNAQKALEGELGNKGGLVKGLGKLIQDLEKGLGKLKDFSKDLSKVVESLAPAEGQDDGQEPGSGQKSGPKTPPWAGQVTTTTTTSHTINTYAIIWGQAVVVQADTVSDTSSAANNTHTISTVFYQYNANGQLSGAKGGSTSTTTGMVMQAKDVNKDGKIDNSDKVGGKFQYEEKEGTTTATTMNTYAVIWGQAVVIKSVTDSDTIAGATSSTSHSETTYSYNAKGQLTGASGFSKGTSSTEVWNDKDRDNVWDEDETEVQTTESDTTNTYRIIWGQALVTNSVTTSTTISGATKTETTSVVNYTYNSAGQLVGASGYADSTSTGPVWNDPDGEFEIPSEENGWTQQDDGTWKKVTTLEDGTKQVQTAAQDGDDWTVKTKYTDSNGLSTTETMTFNTSNGQWESQTVTEVLDENGNVIEETDTDSGVNKKGGWVDSVTETHTENTYAIIAGQAVITKSVSDSKTVTGATVTETHSVTRYEYNASGQLIGATGHSKSVTKATNDDGTVTVTKTRTENIYAIIGGQAVVMKSISQSVTRSNGGAVITKSKSVTTYQYNADGQLIGAAGHSRSVTKTKNADGTVSVTKTRTTNIYAIILGQAVVTQSISKSTTVSGATTTTSTSVTNYRYNDLGQLVGAWGYSDGTTTGEVWNDANKNKTVDEGEMVDTVSKSHTLNSYAIIMGQAMISKSITLSTSKTATSSTTSISTVKYEYNDQGQLVGAEGSGRSNSTTSVYSSDCGCYQNKSSTSVFTQEYRIIWGQAVMTKQTTDTYEGKQGFEGSHTHVEVTYIYNNKGQLIDAVGTGWTTSWAQVFNDPDGDGNGTWGTKETKTDILQEYDVIWGQAVLTVQTTVSDIHNPDGSTERQTMTTVYRYNAQGILIGAEGHGTFSSNDGNGSTTTGTIHQTFYILFGQAVVATSTTTSDSNGPDGSSHSVVTVTYTYDSLGRLTGASGSGTVNGMSIDDDGKGSDYSGDIQQTYIIEKGQALIKTSTTTTNSSETEDGITTNTTTVITVTYTYDSNGHLIGAEGHGTIEITGGGTTTGSGELPVYETNEDGSVKKDANGNPIIKKDANGKDIYLSYTYTRRTTIRGDGTITQKYGIFNGQAKIISSISVVNGTTSSVTDSDMLNENNVPTHRKDWSDTTWGSRTVTTYTYDSNGRQTGKDESKDSWSTTNTTSHVWTDDGKLNYWLDNGKLRYGAVVGGVPLNVDEVNKINTDAADLGAWVGGIDVDPETGAFLVTFQFFRAPQTPGQPLVSSGEDDTSTQSIGSITVSYGTVTSGVLAGAPAGTAP